MIFVIRDLKARSFASSSFCFLRVKLFFEIRRGSQQGGQVVRAGVAVIPCVSPNMDLHAPNNLSRHSLKNMGFFIKKQFTFRLEIDGLCGVTVH